MMTQYAASLRLSAQCKLKSSTKSSRLSSFFFIDSLVKQGCYKNNIRKIMRSGMEVLNEAII